jgi:glycoside/pentoside/hexuronide:cation symporter, GPH family
MKTKVGFGICDMGGNLFFTIIGFYLLYFLTDVVHLAAGLAGTAMMIGKIWDAVTDPMVGYLSDNTRHRMGRRRPYIFYGSFFLLISMVLMFTSPGMNSPRALFIWAAGVYCLLNTAYTVVNIPYTSLLPELTRDYHQRTVLAGYKMSFAVIGTFIGAGAVLPIVDLLPNPRLGWAVMGGVMGGVMLITAMITFFLVREPYGSPSGEPAGFFASYRGAVESKPFLLVLFPNIMNMTGVTIIQGALLYYFTYIFAAKDLFRFALLFLLASSIVFIPVWVLISKKIGKKYSYMGGMALLTAILLLFFATAHLQPVTYTYVLLAIAGIGFATHYVMPHALIPDVTEDDYAKNGIRREGVFYSLWTFSAKVGQAVAIGLSGWILSIFGYVPHAEQSELARLGIRLLCGPVPALFFVGGIIVLSFYPITRTYYENLQKIILEKEKHA